MHDAVIKLYVHYHNHKLLHTTNVFDSAGDFQPVHLSITQILPLMRNKSTIREIAAAG